MGDDERASRQASASIFRPDGAALLSTVQAATNITNQLELVLREGGTGLRANDFDALFFLVTDGPMRPAELLRHTVLTRSPATMHKILTRLAARGLVSRNSHPQHARGVLYEATEEGAELIWQVWPTVERKVIHRFGGHFSPEELERLTELTRRV